MYISFRCNLIDLLNPIRSSIIYLTIFFFFLIFFCQTQSSYLCSAVSHIHIVCETVLKEDKLAEALQHFYNYL